MSKRSLKNFVTNGREGRPNLKRLASGAVENKHGVQISKAEQKQFRSLVTRANQKRGKLLDAERELGFREEGKEVGQKVGQLQLMGRESDIVISKKSASLHQFTSRESFEKRMEYLKRLNSPTYLDDRTREYKRNFIEALKRELGDEESKDIQMKIRMMKPEQFRKEVARNEEINFGYVYDETIKQKANKIRAALGMKLKDLDFDEEYEE